MYAVWQDHLEILGCKVSVFFSEPPWERSARSTCFHWWWIHVVAFHYKKRCTGCCNFFSRNMTDEFNPMHCNSVRMLVIGDHPLTTMIVGFRIWLMVMYVQSFPHCKSFILGLLDLISSCHAMCVGHITPCLLILFCHNYQILMPFWVISPETHHGICSSLIKVEDRGELYTTAHLFVNLLLCVPLNCWVAALAIDFTVYQINSGGLMCFILELWAFCLLRQIYRWSIGSTYMQVWAVCKVNSSKLCS